MAQSLNREDLIKDRQLYPAKTKTEVLKNNVQMVGKKPKVISIVLSIVAVVLVALLLTGFGYQPWWIFALVVVLGLFVTLPVCFNNYWLINDKGVEIYSYSNNDFKKFAQLINLTKVATQRITFDEINRAKIVYRKNVRISPFDFNPDHLSLVLDLRNSQIIDLDLRKIEYEQLLNIVELLNSNQIDVFDKQQILLMLSENKNLFEHFHQKWATV